MGILHNRSDSLRDHSPDSGSTISQVFHADSSYMHHLALHCGRIRGMGISSAIRDYQRDSSTRDAACRVANIHRIHHIDFQSDSRHPLDNKMVEQGAAPNAYPRGLEMKAEGN